jgi:hypothetical protein
MATCPSCGGTLGRDCCNAEECASISRQIEREADELHDGATQLLAQRDQLDRQVGALLSAITKHEVAYSPTSRKFSVNGELYAAADQVRKEREHG